MIRAGGNDRQLLTPLLQAHKVRSANNKSEDGKQSVQGATTWKIPPCVLVFNNAWKNRKLQIRWQRPKAAKAVGTWVSLRK
jgi:hypothetical protein